MQIRIWEVKHGVAACLGFIRFRFSFVCTNDENWKHHNLPQEEERKWESRWQTGKLVNRRAKRKWGGRRCNNVRGVTCVGKKRDTVRFTCLHYSELTLWGMWSRKRSKDFSHQNLFLLSFTASVKKNNYFWKQWWNMLIPWGQEEEKNILPTNILLSAKLAGKVTKMYQKLAFVCWLNPTLIFEYFATVTQCSRNVLKKMKSQMKRANNPVSCTYTLKCKTSTQNTPNIFIL